MAQVNFKLRKKHIDVNTAIPNNQITAQLTGNAGVTFLELKIPVESQPFNGGDSGLNFRAANTAKAFNILNNEIFISPIVMPNGGAETSSPVMFEITLVVEGKKPLEGPFL